MMSVTDLYESDPLDWAEEQARLIREGRTGEIDHEHIAETLEDMVQSSRTALGSHLSQLLMHLLKWDYQSSHRSRSWSVSIGKQRIQIARLMKRNPSFKNHVKPDATLYLDAYEDAVALAELETGLPDGTFPPSNPYCFEVAMTKEVVWPQA
jgi:hypothetical protein